MTKSYKKMTSVQFSFEYMMTKRGSTPDQLEKDDNLDYKNMVTQAMWLGFQLHDVNCRTLGRASGHFIVGRLGSEMNSIHFSPKPYRHHNAESMETECNRLVKDHGGQFAVYRFVKYVGKPALKGKFKIKIRDQWYTGRNDQQIRVGTELQGVCILEKNLEKVLEGIRTTIKNIGSDIKDEEITYYMV